MLIGSCIFAPPCAREFCGIGLFLVFGCQILQ
jgi:hypothetical protein